MEKKKLKIYEHKDYFNLSNIGVIQKEKKNHILYVNYLYPLNFYKKLKMTLNVFVPPQKILESLYTF